MSSELELIGMECQRLKQKNACNGVCYNCERDLHNYMQVDDGQMKAFLRHCDRKQREIYARRAARRIVWCVMFAGIFLGVFGLCKLTADGPELAAADVQRINNALNTIHGGRWATKDWSGDGKVECVDFCMSFAFEWNNWETIRYIYWQNSMGGRTHLTVRVKVRLTDGRIYWADVDPMYMYKWGDPLRPEYVRPQDYTYGQDENMVAWGVYRRLSGVVDRVWWYE